MCGTDAGLRHAAATLALLVGGADALNDPVLPPDAMTIVEHAAIVEVMIDDCKNRRPDLFGPLRAGERAWLIRNVAVASVMHLITANSASAEAHHLLAHYAAIYHQLYDQLPHPAPGNRSCEQLLLNLGSGKLDYRGRAPAAGP